MYKNDYRTYSFSLSGDSESTLKACGKTSQKQATFATKKKKKKKKKQTNTKN